VSGQTQISFGNPYHKGPCRHGADSPKNDSKRTVTVPIRPSCDKNCSSVISRNGSCIVARNSFLLFKCELRTAIKVDFTHAIVVLVVEHSDRIRQSAAIDVMFLEKQIVELGAVMNDDLNTNLLRRRRICTSGCHSSSQSFLQNVAQQKTYSTSTLPCSFLQGPAKGLSMSEHGHLTEFDDPRRW